MQQNAFGMQKIQFKHPASVGITTEAKHHLQPKLELEAKGQTALTFLMKIHPRALERRIKYEEVQQRRKAFECERKMATFVSEEKPVIRSIENYWFLLDFYGKSFTKTMNFFQ